MKDTTKQQQEYQKKLKEKLRVLDKILKDIRAIKRGRKF